MQRQASASVFISLKLKLLLGFTLVFSLVFAAAFYWFYDFTTRRAIESVSRAMVHTVTGAALGLDGSLLVELYRDGEANAAGFSDHPAYSAQMDWFRTVNSIEPRAWPFTYIQGENANEIIWLADLWAAYTPERAVNFAEVETSDGILLNGLRDLEVYLPLDERGVADERSHTFLQDLFIRLGLVRRLGYTDDYGEWVSAYYPVRDATGTIVGAMGIDFEATYVDTIQNEILASMLNAFAITYLTLFLLVFLIANVLTRPLMNFADIARRVAEGQYEQSRSRLRAIRSADEIRTLAEVFELMIERVEGREQQLKQEVMQLKIEIDESKRQEQVSEIVDSDFFKDLKAKASNLRTRRNISKLEPEG